MSIIKQNKDKRYFQFQEVVLEQNLEKTLEYIKMLLDYVATEKKYSKAMAVMGNALSMY